MQRKMHKRKDSLSHLASQAKVSIFQRHLKDRPAMISFLLATMLIVTLCLTFPPRWETNDDVAMSMIAHGYGVATYGSPYLVYSKVLWGCLVRAIPTINGVLGYSVATMGVLLVIGWAMMYFLLRLGVGYLLSLLAVALVIARPTLFPQYTVNAGLLTAAAVIGLQAYARTGGAGNLAAACLLAFFAYLIRDHEFLLVLGVALPLLPWRTIREQRQIQVAFLLLLAAIASTGALERWSYNGPEWRPFFEFQSARVPFNDFGAGSHLKKRPEIMARHGYTQNDIDLIANWFFADRQIADPKSLKAMLAELGPLAKQKGNSQLGFAAVKALTAPVLLPLFIGALLLFVASPRWSVALAWALCLASLFGIGLMGRPGVLRIYIPLLSLLLIAPLLFATYREGAGRRMAALILFAACLGNAYILIPQASASKQMIEQVQSDMRFLPAQTIVSWGGSFPSESAFPVLASDSRPRDIRLYSLGGFTYAPFSVAAAEEKAGLGVVDRLSSAEGLPIINLQGKKDLMLRKYCRQHLNGELSRKLIYQTPSIVLWQVRCEVEE